MPAPPGSRARLERALIEVHRAGRARGPGGRRHAVPADTRRRVAERTPVTEPAPPPPPEDGRLLELVERLHRIEERLAALQRPPRPVPATREVFAEWVRTRRWEEIPFSEFLKLRRAGRI